MVKVSFECKSIYDNDWKKIECEGRNLEEIKGIYCLNECNYKNLKVKKI